MLVKNSSYMYEMIRTELTDILGHEYVKTEDADRFGKKIFEVLHRTKDQFALDKDYKINLEQVPGESCAAKM